MTETTWSVIAWCLAVVVLGWTWLPALLSSLGWTRYATGGSEDPSAVDAAKEADFLFWSQQLVALRFEPLGVAWMSVRFHGPEWQFQSDMRVFRSTRTRTFAIVQRQPRPLDVWWLTLFATCWQDSTLLMTSNGVDQPPGDGEYVLQGMESLNLSAVEELHRGEVARLQAAGRRVDPDGSLDVLLRVMQQHAGTAARQTGMKLGQSYLLAHVAIHAVLSVLPATLMGFAHWSVPFTNLVLGAVLGASYHAAKRKAAVIQRSEIRAWLSDPSNRDRIQSAESPRPNGD
ncbi:MAG TPA: hypothetical protein VHR66_17640 [Gemmataceae bacterium]|nr:hypothetical protein [Gemmataceae bacterium]